MQLLKGKSDQISESGFESLSDLVLTLCLDWGIPRKFSKQPLQIHVILANSCYPIQWLACPIQIQRRLDQVAPLYKFIDWYIQIVCSNRLSVKSSTHTPTTRECLKTVTRKLERLRHAEQVLESEPLSLDGLYWLECFWNAFIYVLQML